jgi:hypothetical protein
MSRIGAIASWRIGTPGCGADLMASALRFELALTTS